MRINDKRRVMVTVDISEVSHVPTFSIDGKPISDFPRKKDWFAGVTSVDLPVGIHKFSGAAIKQISVNGQNMIPTVYVSGTVTEIIITDNTVITFADED